MSVNPITTDLWSHLDFDILFTSSKIRVYISQTWISFYLPIQQIMNTINKHVSYCTLFTYINHGQYVSYMYLVI